MPVANFVESVVFYDDVENASNPIRKHCDWKRSSTGLIFDQVYSERFLLAPGVSRILESTMGSTDLSTTPVTMGAAVGKPTWYQIRGAFPSSPWALALSVGAMSLTCTLQVDGSLLLTGTGLASLAAVKPGDWVYLGGSSYGDAGNFSVSNQGFWVVTAATTGLYLTRIYPEDPTPVTETVTTVGTTDVQHLPNAVRPLWAFIRGSAVFGGLKTVVAAAIGWVAVLTEPQFVPLAAYTFDRLVVAPKYIAYTRVESDQPVTVTVGDVATATNAISLLPVLPLVPVWYEAFAFSTSLAVANLGSSLTATINVIYAISQAQE